MSVSAVSNRTLEEIWERTVFAAKGAWESSTEDDYHLGIFDAHMAVLADLAIHMKRIPTYLALCQELDELSWPLGDSYES